MSFDELELQIGQHRVICPQANGGETGAQELLVGEDIISQKNKLGSC